MFKFAANYFKALAAVATTMVVYGLTVVPLIEPGEKAAAVIPRFDRALGGVRWWADFFAPDDWQAQDPMVINTDRGILLSSSWTQINPETLELKPLTIILPHSRDARRAIEEQQTQELLRQEMWIISADGGAEIRFQEPLELTSGTLPSVVRGELRGAIEVTRKVAADSDAKPWKIRTSDLSIERRKLSTQQEVQIEWDESLIQGRNLKIMLRGEGLLGDVSSSAWGPLDELELFHVDKVDIALPPGGIWAKVDSERFREEPELRTLPARLTATCGGRFAFDFKISKARMQNGVNLFHHLGDLPPDQFFGEEVAFELEPPFASPATSSSDGLSRIQLKSFEAVGVDSLQDFVGEKWVEFNAPTIGASARAKRVQVDLEKQRIELDVRINPSDAIKSTVVLNYQGSEFRAPRIEYQAAPADAESSVRHLGWMIADGPGEISSSADGDVGEAQARWSDSLKMSPAPEAPQLHWIELVGGVLVESKQRGFLTSERLSLWLRKNSQSPAADVGGQAPVGPSRRYLPDRLVATGGAVLATDQIQAQVPELDLKFVHALPFSAGIGQEAAESLPLNDSAGNPLYQWVTPPDQEGVINPTETTPLQTEPADAPRNAPETAPPAATDSVPSSQPPEPIHVTGSQLTARLITTGENSWIDHLQIDGPIRLWRSTAEAGDEDQTSNLPWHIEGDGLSMTTNPQGQADVQIDGQPAKVVAAGGSLESNTIRLDQSHNLVWMNQPGEFTIPLSVANSQDDSPDARRNSSDIEWFNPPHCTWRGRMLFDGKVATIEGDIELDGALRTAPNRFWWIKGSSQRLSVLLATPVDMQAGMGSSFEVAEVQLSENVDIRASQVERTPTDVRTVSRQRIVVPVLSLVVPENKLVGRGQGWIRSYHLAPDRSSTGPSASSDFGRSGLQGAHLKFRDSMVGFLDRSEIVFDGKVELGVAPLASWDETIDLDQMRALQNGQMLLSCDQLKAYDTSYLLAQHAAPVRAGSLSASKSYPVARGRAHGDGSSQTAELRPGGNLAAFGKSGSWEFKATGNVAFNGKAEQGEFHGRGYQLTYVQAQERLILRGDGRSPAQLRRLPTPDSASSFQGDTLLHVDVVYVNPRTLEIQNLQLGQGGLQWQRESPPTDPSVPFPFTPQASPPSIPNPRRDFYDRR